MYRRSLNGTLNRAAEAALAFHPVHSYAGGDEALTCDLTMTEAPAKDVLANEVGVSAELTPTGVKAKAKSRTVSALDRLGGNLIQLLNNPVERKVDKDRARADAETKLIEAWGEHEVTQVRRQTAFATAALEQHAKLMIERETNKAAVAMLALEDLSQNPPSQEESEGGPDRLNDDFLNRFARYAEDASSDQVRERWARVLAKEVRKPGSFSLKVLRLIDELDADVAQIFERYCRDRIGIVIPMCLAGNIPFDEEKRLTTSGLLIDKGVAGQILNSRSVTDASEVELTWFRMSPQRGLAVAGGRDVFSGKPGDVFGLSESTVGVKVYALTDEGQAIASILPDTEHEAVDRLAQAMSDLLPGIEVRTYAPNGEDWDQIKRLVQTPAQEPAV